MSSPRAKKSDSFGLRFEPDLRAKLDKAAAESGMTTPEALRIAAWAMVSAHAKLKRIPRDMEIRQAVILPELEASQLRAAQELLRAAVELDRSTYFERPGDTDLKAADPFPTKPPDKPRKHGAGPDADVRTPA